MKTIFLLLLSLSFTFGFEYNLKPQKVTEGIYCFFGKLENINKKNAGNMVNSCYVQTKIGYVVIDSGPTFSYASQAYTQMQKILKLPVKYVINTHDHDDHWLGNSFYKHKGALLIGPRTYEQNILIGMDTRMQRTLTKEMYAKTSIVKLDTIVDNNLTFTVANKTFNIQKLEDIAHTQGDLIVWLAKSKVLFAGDLVFNGRLTSLRDGSLLGSLSALDKLEAYGAKFIIGGHGFETDENASKSFKRYLTHLKEEVLQALNNDVDMSDITKKVPMTSYKNFKLYDVLHKRNVLDAYKELEMIEDDEE